MIACKRQTALWAIVPALAKRLRYGCATHACLRGAGGIHTQYHATSLCRFVTQDLEELSPSGIVNLSGQHAASESLDGQRFDIDHAVGVDQASRRLVVKIPTLVANLCMGSLEQRHCLAPSLRAALASGHTALGEAQLRLCLLVPARIFNDRTIAQHSKTRKPQVDADVFIQNTVGKVFDLHAETDVPASRFTLDADGLDTPTTGRCSLTLITPTPWT